MRIAPIATRVTGAYCAIIVGIRKILRIALPVVRFINAVIVHSALIAIPQKIAQGATNALPAAIVPVAKNAAAVEIAIHARIVETAATANPASTAQIASNA